MSSPKSKRRITKQPGRAAHGSLHRPCSEVVVTIPKNTIICDRHVRSHMGEYLIRNYTPRELSVTITEHEIIIREA